MMTDEQPKSQADKFADLARELECDDDEEAFKATLRRVAKGRQSGVGLDPEQASHDGSNNPQNGDGSSAD